MADPAHVTAYYRSRVALVQFSAELFNGRVETGEGSGLLVGGSTVITDSHVVPRLADYKSVSITVRLGGRKSPPIGARLVQRDIDADLAVVQLSAAQTVPHPPCPIRSFSTESNVLQGTKLVVLGYPVGRDYSVTGGLLSNQEDPARWQTDAAMNVGNSGGPVFDERGYLLGFAVAGMTWHGDEELGTFVSGVNFFVPVGALMKSTVASALQQAPPCWQIADAGRADTDTAMVGGIAGPADAPASPTHGLGRGPASIEAPTAFDAQLASELLKELSRDVPISFTKNDHPGLSSHRREYTKRVEADPGYRIESCTLNEESANNADRTLCKIAVDGQSATFSTRLRSGPLFDRWRGWWRGTASLSQRLRSVP